MVDQILPDSPNTGPRIRAVPRFPIQITFRRGLADETPRVYGPYTVTSGHGATSVGRGRLMAISVASSDLDRSGDFGLVEYRYAPMGRR